MTDPRIYELWPTYDTAPAMLTPMESSPVAGQAVQTMAMARCHKSPDAPQFVKIGRRVMYPKRDLARWLVAQAEKSGYVFAAGRARRDESSLATHQRIEKR